MKKIIIYISIIIVLAGGFGIYWLVAKPYLPQTPERTDLQKRAAVFAAKGYSDREGLGGGYETDGIEIGQCVIAGGVGPSPAITSCSIIDGVDLDTFEVLGVNYARDKNHVYRGVDILEWADPLTFKAPTGEKYNHNCFRHPVSQPCTCEAIGCCKTTAGYDYDEQNNACKEVFLLGVAPSFKTLAECQDACLDIEFKKYGSYYVESGNQIYETKTMTPLINADPVSFRLLRDASRETDYYGASAYDLAPYARDNNRVYFYEREIAGADPNSFEVLIGNYARDNEKYFYREYTIRGIDNASFSVLDALYQKDKFHVYYGIDSSINGMKILDGADPTTFIALDRGYGKDGSRVFIKGKPLPGVDAATFQVLKYPYTKDKNHVYKFDNIDPGLDPSAFTF